MIFFKIQFFSSAKCVNNFYHLRMIKWKYIYNA
jgi:hypothetical protein